MAEDKTVVPRAGDRKFGDAFTWNVFYSSDGKKKTQQSITVGSIVVWGIVIIVLAVAGQAVWVAAPVSLGAAWKTLALVDLRSGLISSTVLLFQQPCVVVVLPASIFFANLSSAFLRAFRRVSDSSASIMRHAGITQAIPVLASTR